MLPTVRADLLRQLGKGDAAAAEYLAESELSGNDAIRNFLLRGAAEFLTPSGDSSTAF